MIHILQETNLNFIDLPERFKCIFCYGVLKNAKQTSCGRRACAECIKEYLKDGPKQCPSNKFSNEFECANHTLSIDTDYICDNATVKQINRLKVQCPLNPCLVTIELQFIDSHKNLCEYRKINCEKCLDKFIAKNKKEHDKNLCKIRLVKCKYCQKRTKLNEMDFVHLNPDNDEMCDKYWTPHCPNNCYQKLQVNLKSHLKVCFNRKQNCPLDCENERKISKENLQVHLMKHLEKFENDLDELRLESKNYGNIIMEMKSIKIRELQNDREREMFIDKINKQFVPHVLNNGEFIWKIENFGELMMKAKMKEQLFLSSDYFYTKEFEYKLRMWIYPFGYGTWQSTYLSVLVQITSGEYDAILSWPFKHAVTIGIFHKETQQLCQLQTVYPKIYSQFDRIEFLKFVSLNDIINSFLFPNEKIFLKLIVSKD